MEMPGSAPGVLKERWQYCPMRTRRLCGLTLVVLLLHALAWRIASGGRPPFAPARAGSHGRDIVSVPQGARVPLTLAHAGAEPTPPRPAAVPTHPPAAPPARPAAGRPPVRVAPPPRAGAGEGGTRASARSRAPTWPVYATQAPPSTALRYTLVQHAGGAASASSGGDARLDWTLSAATFALRITTTPLGRPPREWESTGHVDTAGVAPSRLVERERGRDKRTINFDRDGQRVRFSGAPGALAIAPGAQDRWSWVAQLAAIAEAGARRGRVDGPWDLQVAGLRGELERWTFRVIPLGEPPPELLAPGNEMSSSADRAPALLHVLRASERPYDLRIEAWLSPSLHHFPAGLRMSTPPGPWSLALWHST
jgi:hypothetical protein